MMSLNTECRMQNNVSCCCVNIYIQQKNLDFSQAEPLFMGMSHAEIKMVCSDIFKESLLNDLPIDMEMVKMIVDKRNQLCREIG